MHHIGIDILRLGRLRPMDGQWDDPFFRRTFTVSEQQHCQAQPQPLMAYAGMFAAKEAVFKALALGADGVLICRPFVTAVYGGGAEGVKCYIDKLAGELADTMQMCGAHTLAEITPDMVRV